MRQSFDNYYKKLNVLYKKEYGTRPTVTFDSKLKKEVIISKENSDGEVEWKMYPVGMLYTSKYMAVYFLIL